MEFFNRNAAAIQAISALLTLLLAVAALIGVKMQIDAAEQIQKAQSARDIYREFLSVSISKPEFARPDYCAIAGTAQEAAYENFVDYMLYTAEQTISVDATWHDTFVSALADHSLYLCSVKDTSDYADTVTDVLRDVQAKHCANVKPCS